MAVFFKALRPLTVALCLLATAVASIGQKLQQLETQLEREVAAPAEPALLDLTPLSQRVMADLEPRLLLLQQAVVEEVRDTLLAAHALSTVPVAENVTMLPEHPEQEVPPQAPVLVEHLAEVAPIAPEAPPMPEMDQGDEASAPTPVDRAEAISRNDLAFTMVLDALRRPG